MIALQIALVLAGAAALSAYAYLRLEGLGRRAWPPMVARGVAWAALGLLLVNVGCPRPPVARRAIVLLDGSLSMVAAGGHWSAAHAAALKLGDVRLFGDERAAGDSLPDRGRSLLAAALAAAGRGHSAAAAVPEWRCSLSAGDSARDRPASV